MIQRKQSLFLLIAGICFLISIVTKIGIIRTEATEEKPYQEEVQFYSYEAQYKEIAPNERLLIVPNKPIAFLALYLGLVSILCIFLYKNRQMQIKLTRVNTLLSITLVFMMLVYLFRIQQGNLRGEPSFPEFGVAIVFGILGAVSNILANKAIKADEELLKSVDRIR